MSSHPLALDAAKLAEYLGRHLPGFAGPLTATKFKGGQSNPTYLLESAGGRYVLRRKPPGVLLSSAHAVDREFRVLQALALSDVPVPSALHLCKDDAVIGSMFYVMSFVDGVVHRDPALAELPRDVRRDYWRELVRVLGTIHSVDLEARALFDFGKANDYFARQLRRWTEQYRASELQKIEAMEQLIAWLGTHLPPDDGSVSLVHGDFRIDNLIYAHDGPTVLAVVDWELSTLGHPLSDLAYLCMAMRLPRNPVVPGLLGIDREAENLPSEDEIKHAYSTHTGRPIEHWSFALAFCFFRLAAIAQGVAKRAQQGNASNEQADRSGAMVPVIASLGLEATRGV